MIRERLCYNKRKDIQKYEKGYAKDARFILPNYTKKHPLGNKAAIGS